MSPYLPAVALHSLAVLADLTGRLRAPPSRSTTLTGTYDDLADES